jgi:hyperosmotically inducible protein
VKSSVCSFHLEEVMIYTKRIFCYAVAVTCLASGGIASSQPAPQADAQWAQQTKKATRAQNHQLARNVRQALSKTKNLTSSAVTVLARGGKVTLNGTVPADEQIAIASEVASGVPGVSGVENNLLLRVAGH